MLLYWAVQRGLSCQSVGLWSYVQFCTEQSDLLMYHRVLSLASQCHTITMAQTACLRRVASFLSSGLCKFEHRRAHYGQVEFPAVNSP